MHQHQRDEWENHQCSEVEKKIFCVWDKEVENYVSGVFPNVRGALVFAVAAQDVITAAAVALAVPGLGVDVYRDRRTTFRSVVSLHGR